VSLAVSGGDACTTAMLESTETSQFQGERRLVAAE
jgi:hypothetical protein